MDTKEQLLNAVLRIVGDLESPPMVLADDPSIVMQDNEAPCGDCYTFDDEAEVWRDMDGDEVETQPQSGYDYISNALDIEFTLSSNRDLIGARIAVTLGGPSIFIDTQAQTVTGHWGGDTISRSYDDNIGLDDAACELFEMGA